MNFETAFKNYSNAEAALRDTMENDRGESAYRSASAALDSVHADLLNAPVTSVQQASTLFDVLWVHYYPDDTEDALNATGAVQLIDRVRVVLHELAAKPRSSVGRIGRA